MYPFSGKTVLGITGGVACGKSTVCQKLSYLGWEVISTDSCTHELLQFDKVIIEKIRERWGNKVFDNNGNIDRRNLSDIVFNSVVQRSWLESILHPKIRENWTNLILKSSNSLFAVEIPLLFENNLNDHFTKTICVHASSSIQNIRLKKRGLSEEEIKLRLKSQLPLSMKSNLADFVISCDGEPYFLDFQINKLLSQIS